MPGIMPPPPRGGTPPPSGGGPHFPHITTLWQQCGHSLMYPNASAAAEAVAFYLVLVVIAALVVFQWKRGRSKE